MTPKQRERRRRRRHPMTEIAIYSDIDSQGGFGPQALREALADADGGPMTVRLNSEGGNVIDGLACYNLLRSYEGETTVVIDGMALSIASLVACGADKVKMAENAWLMVHNPHNQAAGDGDDLRDMAGLLDGMRDQLAKAYATRSKKPVEEVLKLMSAETWMTGPQALEAGFVDEVTASLEVAATFDATRFSKPPRQKLTPLETAVANEIPALPGETITWNQHKEPAMAAATFTELKAAFPRASADFLVRCQASGHTLDKARAEFDEENAKALDEKEKELAEAKAGFEEFKENADKEKEAKAEEEEKKAAEAKATEDEEKKAAEAKAKSGVTPAGGGSARGGSGASSGFMSCVKDRMKLGASKAQAVSQTVQEEPELHREFVQAHNASCE